MPLLVQIHVSVKESDKVLPEHLWVREGFTRIISPAKLIGISCLAFLIYYFQVFTTTI